ncbi:hypothetical protein EUGRSUZ_B00507 [Eucalyptus grandis]|uniref:Uncharacterized protein n=2 Tax=Eucalyptus grandis TaxID=71139 RepID=A0ACC3LP67_EUCGR|nr:hypothetical protein EUGRSUZ_B00507 [Eucalyptus grandis]
MRNTSLSTTNPRLSPDKSIIPRKCSPHTETKTGPFPISTDQKCHLDFPLSALGNWPEKSKRRTSQAPDRPTAKQPRSSTLDNPDDLKDSPAPR